MEKLRRLGILSGVSLVFAVAQSLCTAVITISALRVAIGVGALVAGSMYEPLVAFHRSAIRVPMLIVAVAGSIINLLVLAWIWRMRRLPSAQWRRRDISRKERRSEWIQVVLALLTLVLVALEAWTHAMLHHGASAF